MNYNDNSHSIYSGKKLNIEVFGTSHGEEIGVNAKGITESVDLDELKNFLDRRKAKNTAYSTKRIETDEVIFESGLVDNKLLGDFRAVIKNNNQKSKDYSSTYKKPRPAHADFVGYTKYGDNFDFRGGGKFSGRLTAPMCIVGGVLKQALEKKGIKINAYISQIGNVKGTSYKDLGAEFSIPKMDKNFPLLDDSAYPKMMEEIKKAKNDLDSVGGIIECVITGVPVGTGEYMFDSLESIISHLAFAVPAVKGIEFGTGFDLASMFGSKANDSFYYKDGVVKTLTNNNGGINGGMANGMPITFRVVIKPTPSIAKEQDSVDLVTKENIKLKIEGRHDACIVPRAVPVIESISAIAIYDNL